MALNVLILGGTADANEIAERLAGDARYRLCLSLAGRTTQPRLPPVEIRIGGFGGVAGLADHLTSTGTGALIDATHPFATRISANARAAASIGGVPLIIFERPAWVAQPGDRWTQLDTLAAAAARLPRVPARVFLTVGRQSLAPFAAHPQHHYIIRVIDPPVLPPELATADIVTARGPFNVEDEIATMRRHRAQWLVTKNSGGAAAYAKLTAARALGLPVILVERSARILPAGIASTVPAVVAALNQLHDGSTNRSV